MEGLNILDLLKTSARAKMTTLFILQSMLASQNQAKSPLRCSSVLEESQMRSHFKSIAMANSIKTLDFMKFQLTFLRTSISTSMVIMRLVFMQLTTDLMLLLHGILAQLRSGIKKDLSKVQTMESKQFINPFLQSTSLTLLRSHRSPQSFLLQAQLFSSLPSSSTLVIFSVLAVLTSLVCPSGESCSL
jgi:hypothetical protein